MSPLVTRPALPVPSRAAGSRPVSAERRRTAGEISAAAPDLAATGAAFGTGAAEAAGLAAGAGVGAGGTANKRKRSGGKSDDWVIRGQKFHQRNRDLSALITAGIYILNIVDANVDAHLMQFNVNDNLSVKPDLNQNEIDYKYNYGLTLTYNF